MGDGRWEIDDERSLTKRRAHSENGSTFVNSDTYPPVRGTGGTIFISTEK